MAVSTSDTLKGPVLAGCEHIRRRDQGLQQGSKFHFELLPEYPVITMPLVTCRLSMSRPTAGKTVDVLIKASILAEVGERKRDRLYRHEAFLKILD